MITKFKNELLMKLSSSVPAHRRQDTIGELADYENAEFAVDLEDVLSDVLINDDNPIVRHEAAFGLGKLYNSRLIRGNRAVVVLSQAVCQDPSVVVRHEAAEALGNFHSQIAYDALRSALTDAHNDVVETAALSLTRNSQT